MNLFLRLWMLFLLLPLVQHGQDTCHQFVYGLNFLVLDALLHINVLVKNGFCTQLVLIEQFLFLLVVILYRCRGDRKRGRVVLLFFQFLQFPVNCLQLVLDFLK